MTALEKLPKVKPRKAWAIVRANGSIQTVGKYKPLKFWVNPGCRIARVKIIEIKS